MTTHITTHNPVRSDLHDAGPTTSPGSRAWALAGVGAGLAGIGTIVTSSLLGAVYDEDLVGQPEAIAGQLADQVGVIVAFHLCTLVAAVLMVPFAAGLHRRLRSGARDGADALAPVVALAGVLGTAIVLVLGSGLDTEFMLGEGNKDFVNPANAAMFNHWVGTIPWVWVLAGLAGVAVHAAARSGAAPRWLGRVGLVLGGLTLLLGISPLQYMAGMTGPLWLLVTAVGFAVGDKASRAA